MALFIVCGIISERSYLLNKFMCIYASLGCSSESISIETGSIHIVEVGMLKGGQGRNASVRVESHESSKEIDLELVEGRGVLDHWHAAELRESRFEVIKLQGIWPVIFIGSTKDLKDFEYLIDLRITHEKRSTLHHLGKDATGRPQIDS